MQTRWQLEAICVTLTTELAEAREDVPHHACPDDCTQPDCAWAYRIQLELLDAQRELYLAGGPLPYGPVHADCTHEGGDASSCACAGRCPELCHRLAELTYRARPVELEVAA